MNMLMDINSDFVMSSIDFLNDVINPARVAALGFSCSRK
uniref:Uncharacterized protein n=3 Tax=unclassified Caudoviricetes TaxID=2788787 RepID=A0AAU8GD01_9CAUD